LSIFRKEALERMRNPDNLDQMLLIVKPGAWLFLSALTLLVVFVVLWAFLSSIPVTVEGIGVLVYPGKVQAVHAPGEGEIRTLHVVRGQLIEVGDIVAELDRPQQQQEIEQAREQLIELQDFDAMSTQLESKRLEEESKVISEQSEEIREELELSRTLARVTDERASAYAVEQLKQLQTSRERMISLVEKLETQIENLKSLRKDGLVVEESLLSATSTILQSKIDLTNIDLRIQDLEMGSIRRQREQLQFDFQSGDLEMQILVHELKIKHAEHELALAQAKRTMEIQQLQHRISGLELQLQESSIVMSPYAGQVLEIGVEIGHPVTAAQSLITVGLTDSVSDLRNISYLSIKDGRLVSLGDKVLVTPANADREDDGAVIGEVVDISPYPINKASALIDVGNELIVNKLIESGGAIAVECELERDSSSVTGYRWTSNHSEAQLFQGTPTTIRVVRDRESPIEKIIPLLRGWVFGEIDDKKPDF